MSVHFSHWGNGWKFRLRPVIRVASWPLILVMSDGFDREGLDEGDNSGDSPGKWWNHPLIDYLFYYHSISDTIILKYGVISSPPLQLFQLMPWKNSTWPTLQPRNWIYSTISHFPGLKMSNSWDFVGCENGLTNDHFQISEPNGINCLPVLSNPARSYRRVIGIIIEECGRMQYSKRCLLLTMKKCNKVVLLQVVLVLR